MGLFDKVAEMAAGVMGGQGGNGNLIGALVSVLGQQEGGLQGLMAKAQQLGLGDIVQSWIGKGANEPIAPAQVSELLGPDTVNQLASKVGTTAPEVTDQLSQLLPGLIDRISPNGQLPTGGIADIAQQALGSLFKR